MTAVLPTEGLVEICETLKRLIATERANVLREWALTKGAQALGTRKWWERKITPHPDPLSVVEAWISTGEIPKRAPSEVFEILYSWEPQMETANRVLRNATTATEANYSNVILSEKLWEGFQTGYYWAIETISKAQAKDNKS